jgi:putative peptidoglycan lipid II flippase
MKLDFLRRTPKRDSTNKKIFRVAVLVGVLAIVVKTLASVKELVVARSFGRSDTLDAFLIAYLVPSFVVSLSSGALASALIPVLVERRQKEGTAGVQRLLSSMALLITATLIAVAALLAVLAPYYLPWIGHGFSAAKLHLTREVLYALLPFVLFSGMALFVSSTLNALEVFGFPALVPLMTPLVTIAFIVFAAARWGAFSLAAGVVMGSLLEGSLLLVVLRRHGIQLEPTWKDLDPDVGRVLSQYAPMFAGALLMGGTSVVDQSMAAMLPGGSVAALSYANKIVGAVLAIGGTALSTGAFPYFSKMVAGNDWPGLRHTLKRYSVLVVLATVPFTLLLVFFSKGLVRVLFQHGAFSSADTELVSWVQICYAAQIPFHIWSLLFVRFLCSIRRNDLLMYLAAVNLALDVVLNLVLMRIWGVAGIAMSTSIVTATSFALLAIGSLRLLSPARTASFAAPPAQETAR